MTVEQELAVIARKHRGLLDPEQVVAFAADPATALHGCFTWDDTEAARQHRLWQARQVILRVRVQPCESVAPTRLYVSLTTDRGAGGYRRISDVLGDQELRRQLLEEAFRDLERLRAKYETLQELAGVFSAAKAARARASRKAAAASQE